MRDEIDDLLKLPSGWIWTKLGEVASDPRYGWTTSAVADGKLHLLRTTDITSGHVDWISVPFCGDEPPDIGKYILHDGDIVISRAGSVGYSHLVKNPPKSVFASYLIRFQPLINHQYFAMFLTSPSYWGSISDKSIGIALANVNASKLKQISVPLPPLPEQHRIVAKIEELLTRLDAGVESLKKIEAQLKRYRQAVLKHAFEGKLTEEWRQAHKDELEPASLLLELIKQERRKTAGGRYKELPPLDTSDLRQLPRGWVWARVGETYDIVGGGTPSTAIGEYWEGDIPWITSADVYGLKDIRPRRQITRQAIENSATNLVPSGSLIVVTRVGLGKIALTKTAICSSQDSQALVAGKTSLYPEYSLYCLSEAVQVFKHKHRGTTINGVTKKQLAELPFPVPPLPEQHRIVEEIERRFSVADQIEETIEHGLKQAERLRQSILKRAFEGKLVAQDPNDEPAEQLLERIEEDRAKHQAAARSAKAVKKKATTEEMRLM